MKIIKIFLVVLLFTFCEKLDFLWWPIKLGKKEPEWVKLLTKKLGIGSEGYFVTVSVSTLSITDAETKCKEELTSLIYNLTNEYLSRLNPTIKTDLDFILKDLVKKQIKDILQKASNYFEVRDKYENKKEKKYYVLGGMQSEQLLKMLIDNLETIYQKENLFNLIKENEEIYRVKISSEYQDKIKLILEGNNFIIDNENYFAQIVGSPFVEVSSKLASLSGPLWTVKAQYIIYLKDKKGNVIGKIFSSKEKGVANSKEEAEKKALKQVSIDFNQLRKYIPKFKKGIERYLEEEIKTVLTKTEEKTTIYYADALKYYENKDYQTALSLLENIHVLNKDFPTALILYLRTKGKLEGERVK